MEESTSCGAGRSGLLFATQMASVNVPCKSYYLPLNGLIAHSGCGS